MEFIFNSLFFLLFEVRYRDLKKSDVFRVTVNALSVLCVCKMFFENPFFTLKKKIGDLFRL